MEFKQLASPVKQAIDQVLADKWPGMEVSRVVKFTAGSVLAHVEVVARDESQEPTPAELVGQVENRASAGRIGTFEIEPTTIRAARLNKGQ
uniref:Uncharacterized protein n=1 Tax=Plectus sambesii TaxID=2011161 RepID=A0A914WG08_9BILA